MIDINLIRTNKELVKENIKKKFQDQKLPLVDEVETLDKKIRELKQEGDTLRASRNTLSSEIGKLMKEKKLDEANRIKEQVKKNNERIEEIVKEEPDILEQVQATAAETEDEYVTMSVEFKGNQVLYVTTFKDAFYTTKTESAAQELEKSMNGAASEFSALAEAVDDAMGAPRGTVSMVIRYCDSDGSVLAEAEFKAEE